MLKVENEIVPKIIKDLFKHSSSNYDLRNDRGFVSNFVKTVFLVLVHVLIWVQDYEFFYLRT